MVRALCMSMHSTRLGGCIIGLEMDTVYSTLGACALPVGIEVMFAPAEECGTAQLPTVDEGLTKLLGDIVKQ